MRTKNARTLSLAAAAGVLLVGLLASPAAAYIGPGAGIAFLGSFMVLFATLFVAGLSLLTWPVRFVIRTLRNRRALRRSRIERLVVLGLDGLDPRLCKRFMQEGKLPNFQRLAEAGCFRPLASTYPCMSPVAWSTFMTGVNPAKHNIFDFLSRDPRSYAPAISSSLIEEPSKTAKLGRFVIPLNRPAIRLLRKSVPFWKILGGHGVPSQVIRVPITFPPDRFQGQMLSAMCVPDLRGTQGSFTFWSTDPEQCRRDQELGEVLGGERHLVERRGNVIRAEIPGPPNALSRKREILQLPFVLTIDEAERSALLELDGKRITLRERQYTDWVQLSFKAGLGIKVHGIARFYITRMDEQFALYMTPIHLDPEHPAMPISHPGHFAIYLAKLFGRYATLGLAEDTWALNERVIDEQAFLEQALLFHEEREQQFWNALDKTRKGVCVCVFDATDRIQHMFYRYIDEQHPAHDEADAPRWRRVIEDMYERCDRMVGTILERAGDEKTAIMVISDHGFATFRRGVNVNRWLLEQGFLHLKEGQSGNADWFGDVDWSRTRAYAFGLGGIFVNLKGREGQGIVERGQEEAAVKAAIIERLSGLRDPDSGERAVLEVVDGDRVYNGPYAENGPDLIVGFNRGYRVSWGCAVGKLDEPVIADNLKSWSGDHCIDPRQVPGVFFCNRDIAERQPGIVDLAPTILDLFGVERPAHMDGQILTVGQPGETVAAADGPEDRRLPAPQSLNAKEPAA